MIMADNIIYGFMDSFLIVFIYFEFFCYVVKNFRDFFLQAEQPLDIGDLALIRVRILKSLWRGNLLFCPGWLLLASIAA